jgi:hypothetical protein
MTISANPDPALVGSAGVDERIAALAATQHLCFSREQALALGAPPWLITRRVRAGRWQRVHPGVYALVASPDPWMQRLWAGWLAVGDPCFVTHATAASFYGSSGYARPQLLEYIAPHGTHQRVAGAFVHQIDDVLPDHVTSDLPACPGLPVTTLARTVVDLAASASRARLRHLITQHVAARRLRLDAVSIVLGEVARPGKPGVKRLARVIDSLAGDAVPRSVAEAAFFAALRAHGVALPDSQIPLPGRGAIPGIVDALYRAARLIVEVDSRTWHGRFSDMSRDRLRDAEAARAGYLTLRIMYEHIRFDAKWTADTVRDVLAVRTALAEAS